EQAQSTAAAHEVIRRDPEVVDVLDLFRGTATRLVTLTGPGGIGKTRLALQIASQLVEDFPHGVFIISLAPISLAPIADAALVSSVIAQVLEVGEVNNTPLIQSLQAHVRERAVFMLLDNFEQVVAAAPVVADLLEASP